MSRSPNRRSGPPTAQRRGAAGGGSRTGQTPRQPGWRPQTSRRRPLLFSGLAGFVVIAVVAAIVIVKLSSGGGTKTPTNQTGVSDAQVITAATSVPISVLDKVGLGSDLSSSVLPPMKIRPGSPLLTSAGKPEILYMGAEYCPYCGAERWAMVVALSQLGKFSNLHTTSSSSTDLYPNTPTFTFYKSTYTSQYISFVPVEQETRSQAPLQKPTAEQTKLFNTYEATPYLQKGQSQGIPFVDIGNRFLMIGPSYSPSYLHSGTSTTASALPIGTVAGSLSLASTPIAKVVDAAANYYLAAICSMTHNTPAKVCNAPGPKKAEAALAAEKSP